MPEPTIKPTFAESKTGQILLKPHKAVLAGSKYTKDKGLQIIIWMYQGAKEHPKVALGAFIVFCAIIGTVMMNIDDFIILVKKLTGLSSILPSSDSSAVVDTAHVLEPQ